MTPLVGVIPAADRGGTIGGAPLPLLQTGEGTFLDRAIAVLRAAGVGRVFVGVRNARDPVAVQALRAGAEVTEVEVTTSEPEASLHAAEAQMAAEGASSVAFLLLPPTFSCVREATIRSLVQGWLDAGGAADVAAPLLPRGTAMADLPWTRLAPLILRGPGAADRLRGLEPEDLSPLRIPVTDPGVGACIDTLPLYRRHFPQAFRKRFQKW
jgi:hypothetical protein